MTRWTSTDLVFDPLLPLGLVAAFGCLALLVMLYALARQARGSWWRLAALCVLVLALLGPSLAQEQRQALDDVVLLAVDRSASQDLGARAARRDQAVAALERQLGQLDGIRVEAVDLAGPQAPQTLLAPAIDAALREIPASQRAGVIVVSDGAFHDDFDDLGALRDLQDQGAPLPRHLLLSSEEAESDRAIHILQGARFGVVGEALTLTLGLEDTGFGDAAIPVEVRLDGIRHDTIGLRPGGRVEIDIPVERAGPHLVEVAVAERPGELTGFNNQAVHAFDGVRDRLRVLLISGLPYAGERAWRNTLKSDPSVDLVHFTILRSTAHEDPTPINELSLITFPVYELFEERIGEFDLIILDRYQRQGLLPADYFANIADYVDQGGALLVVTGPAFAGVFSTYNTGLAEILPAAPTGEILDGAFRPRPTALGLRHPVVAGLSSPGTPSRPWGRWLRQIALNAPPDTVVMSGLEDQPLLMLDRVGEGRVAELASDHIWLWRRGFDGGGPQAELIRRLAHWLMAEPDLEEERLTVTALEGDRARIERRTLAPDIGPVALTAPDGSTVELALTPEAEGLFATEVTLTEPGVYRAREGDLIATFGSAATFEPEWQQILPQAADLDALRTEAGWSVLRLDANPEPTIRYRRPGAQIAGPDWLTIWRNDQAATLTAVLTPLAPPWLAALVLLLLLGLAWWREGHRAD